MPREMNRNTVRHPEWAWAHQAEVYAERDLLVIVLSKIYPSHLMRHTGKQGGNRKPVVCIHSPAGQLCWTLPGETVEAADDYARQHYRHLKWTENDWDGHKTKDRYERLAKI
jgi:hypothetical protein